MCLPRMDGPSVFATMLDRGAGSFRLGPADVMVPSGRRYIPGTMILETTWAVPTGWAVIRDVLLIGPWRHQSPRASRHERAPSDHCAEHILLRTIRCLNGAVDITLECEPAFDYGRKRGAWRYSGSGYGQAECAAESEPLLQLTTDLNLGFEGPLAMARRRLHAGERDLTEHRLDHLTGYDGARPVRIGNRVDETDDGFTGAEGTFTICSFWLVSALADIGEVTRARTLCEKLLSFASPLLLYAEEIEAHTGRHLGNFPQAFSHLALIKAVTRLIIEDEKIIAERAMPAAPPRPRERSD